MSWFVSAARLRAAESRAEHLERMQLDTRWELDRVRAQRDAADRRAQAGCRADRAGHLAAVADLRKAREELERLESNNASLRAALLTLGGAVVEL